MGGEIVVGHSLHQKDDDALVFMVEALINALIVPVADPSALGRTVSLVRPLRVVDDDEIGATAGQGACRRERGPRPSVRQADLVSRLRELKMREERSVLR